MARSARKLTNEMSWSRSRISTLDQCRRQYYYQYYLKWEGWDRRASRPSRTAYFFSKMKDLPLICGQAVHDTIKEVLDGVEMTGKVILDDPEKFARAWLAEVWRGAEQEMWRQSLKNHPPLFELYYGPRPSADRLKEVGQKAAGCVRTFMESPLFADLLKDGGEGWLAVDEGPSFDDDSRKLMLDGRPVWALPDFARRIDGDVCEIWDWKTGVKSHHDHSQLLSYALFARDVWGFPAEKIRPMGFYLATGEVVEYACDARSLARIEEDIRQDFALMSTLVRDAASNAPLPVEDAFPMIDVPEVCGPCFFKEMCGKVEETAAAS